MDRLWRNLRPFVAAALLLGFDPFPRRATAAEDYRLTNEVVLTDVRVSPATKEERSRMTFVLENRSAEPISFTGIAVAGARLSRIVASVGSGATTTLSSIPVAPGDVLSADGESLWIEIDGLTRDLPPGGTIEATLSIGAARVPISLTVDHVTRETN